MGKQTDIAIIGAGASGMAAAIAAGRKGRSVTLIEAQPRAGRKLLSTGNGRCNISNSGISPLHYRSGDHNLVASILETVSPSEIIDFLGSLGIEFTEDREGRIYPRSEQASAVLDLFRAELDRLGVSVVSDCRITSVRRIGDGFLLEHPEGRINSRRAIVACGSPASPQLGGSPDGVSILAELGHKSVAFTPALVGLKVNSPHLKALKGVRWRCRLTLIHNGKTIHSEDGEVQFNEDNLSGIVTMQMSSRAARLGGGCVLCADLLPEHSLQQVIERLSELKNLLGHMPIESFLSGILNKRLAVCALKQAGIFGLNRPAGQLSNRQVNSLAGVLKRWEFPVTGNCGWKTAQVASGGLLLRQFGEDLQSKTVPGLYACGEVLDCDGDCGGFNLHWAWCTGIIAGRAAAER